MTISKLHIKSVELSGYKSINNVKIDFDKGLNIIIGKNSAGKTNFITFLYQVLQFHYEDLNNFKARIMFKNLENIDCEYHIEKSIIGNNFFTPDVKQMLKIDNVEPNQLTTDSEKVKLFERNFLYYGVTFIPHGLPSNYIIVDKPFKFKIKKDDTSTDEIIRYLKNINTPTFIKNILMYFVSIIVQKDGALFEYENDKIREVVNQSFYFINKLKNVLEKFSPIEDVRFSNNFNIYKTSSDHEILFDNIFLEFKINGDWLPFEHLSDGTKRIFYVLSEIYDFNNLVWYEYPLNITSLGKSIRDEWFSRIILIEEPELGIHPHQFKKILDFISEQSIFSQIIMTTHSPQALNILEEKDLGKVVIAYANENNRTKLRKLTDSELKKAKSYIEEEFLSDYWLYSDLEK